MRQKPGTAKPTTEAKAKESRRRTRQHHSAEEEIRIVFESLRTRIALPNSRGSRAGKQPGDQGLRGEPFLPGARCRNLGLLKLGGEPGLVDDYSYYPDHVQPRRHWTSAVDAPHPLIYDAVATFSLWNAGWATVAIKVATQLAMNESLRMTPFLATESATVRRCSTQRSSSATAASGSTTTSA